MIQFQDHCQHYKTDASKGQWLDQNHLSLFLARAEQNSATILTSMALILNLTMLLRKLLLKGHNRSSKKKQKRQKNTKIHEAVKRNEVEEQSKHHVGNAIWRHRC